MGRTTEKKKPTDRARSIAGFYDKIADNYDAMTNFEHRFLREGQMLRMLTVKNNQPTLLADILQVFNGNHPPDFQVAELAAETDANYFSNSNDSVGSANAVALAPSGSGRSWRATSRFSSRISRNPMRTGWRLSPRGSARPSWSTGTGSWRIARSWSGRSCIETRWPGTS